MAHADIDPHIAGAGIEERIARVAEPGDVEMRRLVLVVDADIDVADTDAVADILGGAVVRFVEHGVILPDPILGAGRGGLNCRLRK